MEVIGVTDKNKKNMAHFLKQDGDCKLRRAQEQLKRPTIKTCQLRKIEKNSMNAIVEKNRSKTQR